MAYRFESLIKINESVLGESTGYKKLTKKYYIFYYDDLKIVCYISPLSVKCIIVLGGRIHTHMQAQTPPHPLLRASCYAFTIAPLSACQVIAQTRSKGGCILTSRAQCQGAADVLGRNWRGTQPSGWASMASTATRMAESGPAQQKPAC